MRISVIVPNHNRDLSILRHDLSRSTYPSELFEINLGLERSAQRNIGIKEAINKYGTKNHCLLILDSDQTISRELLKECVEWIKCGFSCLYIPEIIIADSWFGKIRKFERQFYTSTAVDVPRFIRADCCPLFDEEMSGPEDCDWGNRIPGYRATTINPLYHNDDIGPGDYFKKKNYYGKSMRLFAIKNPKDKVINLKYRCWTIFTEDGKWKELVKHPILTLGVILLLLGRGIIYAKNR
jgi:hypothetical protein